MLANMTISLIEHKRIITTIAKAKALRVYAEPIITRSKKDTMHNRRMVFSYLQSKEAIKELFGTVSDKVGDRPGGYTRIIKLPRRMGDAADMALIELVDFNETYNTSDKAATKKTRRSRRSAGTGTTKPAAETTATAEATSAAATDMPATETTEAPSQEGGNTTDEATA
jgi:large subunit ribosomal protein L17